MPSFFITGTDTEVGKTAVTTALLEALVARGDRAVAVKPVQTGCLRTPEGLAAPDVLRYRSTGAEAFALRAYEPACSPHLAAREAGEALSASILADEFRRRTPKDGWTLVEGAGGVFAPVSEDECLIDLMVELALPVVLVVGNRLGCINHARLTVEALTLRGLAVAGMILNRVRPEEELDPGAGDDVENQRRFLRDNAATLARWGEANGIPLLADIPFSASGAPQADLFARMLERLEAFAPEGPSIEEDLEFDRRHLWHPYTSPVDPIPVECVARAKGRTLTLADGRRLVDGTSSWWCAMHGYGDRELVAAVQKQAAVLPHVMFGGLTHKPAVSLGRRLLEALPAFSGVFFADSGSVAIEVAQKMAVQYWQALGHPERNRFITPLGGYHGDTQGAMSVCDPVSGMHGLFRKVLREQIFVERPSARFDALFDAKAMHPLEEAFKMHHAETAALILEPILQGAGGMWFYHPEYLRRARELCDRYGVLLIADEIATGFGRTGRAFACDWAGVTPDIMTVGKGLTGGMMTLAAVLATDRVREGIGSAPSELGGGAFMHGPTFMANPLACAAASASLDKFARGDWKTQAPMIEAALREGLMPLLGRPGVADVRVLGAVGVVETVSPVDTRRLQPAFVERGVWVRPFGNLVYLMPPMTSTPEELALLTGAVRDVVERFIVSQS